MPSIVSTALAPPVGPAKLRLVLLLVIASAPGSPVFWLTRASRDPLASVTTLALTPRFWPLMYFASVVSVSLLPFVMVMACVAPVAPPICKSISPVVAPVGKNCALAPPGEIIRVYGAGARQTGHDDGMVPGQCCGLRGRGENPAVRGRR